MNNSNKEPKGYLLNGQQRLLVVKNYGNSIFSNALESNIEKGALPIGNHQNLGDSGMSELIVDKIESFIEINKEKKTAICSSGITMSDLLAESVKNGLIPFVMPSGSMITVGGAIASNAYGISSHRNGNFCDHVKAITINTTDGKSMAISRKNNSELFHATCGGIGSTGHIIGAEITLRKINGNGTGIDRLSVPSKNLEETLQILDGKKDSINNFGKNLNYEAWIDCSVMSDKKIGRGIIYVTKDSKLNSKKEIAKIRKYNYSLGNNFNILNNNVQMLISKTRYLSERFLLPKIKRNVSFEDVIFSSDKIKNWKDMYGKKGIYQFDAVIKRSSGPDFIVLILRALDSFGVNPLGISLRSSRRSMAGNLNFSGDGYIISVTLHGTKESRNIIHWLNDIVVRFKGKIYSAKDFTVNRDQIEKMYSEGIYLQRKALLNMDVNIESKQINRYGFLD